MSDPGQSPPGRGLTVMTINVGNGLAPDQRVLAALRSSDADIIGIEELNRRQALVLEEGLGDSTPIPRFSATATRDVGCLAATRLSRRRWWESSPIDPTYWRWSIPAPSC